MRLANVFALALFALVATPASAQSPVDSGRAIAKANCGRCHAIGLRGKSPNPKSPPFRGLAKRYPLTHIEEALAEGIVVGHEGAEMPAFELSTRQIEALLAYLASVQRK
jgi:mono/diheme cytochrome c family protein